MRILYVLPSLDNNGPVNMCLELIKAIKEEYDDIYISVLALGEGYHKKNFSELVDLQISSRLDFSSIQRKLNQPFDIIHSHCFVCDLFTFALCKNKNKFTTLHNCFDKDFIDRKGFLVGKFQSFLAKNIIRKFNKIACSKSVYEYYLNNVNGEKLFYVKNGSGNYQQKIINKTSDKLNFFYVGSFIYRKNVEFLLKNFQKWCEHKNVIFHLFGTGELYEEFKEKYSSPKIIFYGHVNNIKEYIKGMDCCLSASRAEGLPMSIVEALSLGVPFIGSDIEPHKEILYTHNKPSGLIFSIDNSYEFIEKLNILYENSNLLKEYSYNSLENYKNHFTAASMMKKYMKYYESSLVGEHIK